MNIKFLRAITTVASIAAAAATAIAAPLPNGTLLSINATTDPAGVVPCTNGSCFGMFLVPGLYYWTPIHPGTDGGIIIGKAQKSGGQEIDALSQANGEITAAWNYGANWGTFFTAPDASRNIFDDASCTGAGCGSNTTPRVTDLAVWNTAWNQMVIPAGRILPGCETGGYIPEYCYSSQNPSGIYVKTWTIDPPGSNPRNYRLTYNTTLSSGFPNFPFELILSGTVSGGEGCSFGSVAVTPSSLTGISGVPIPFMISAIDPYGTTTCRVGTPPANGVVKLNACTSGTYTADGGFVGTDSFTLIANDGLCDNTPKLVNVAITVPSTSPSPTATPTPPPVTPTATPTPTIIVDGCPMIYPVSQTTLMGKQGHLSMTVTGNIVSVNANSKEIKICPYTTVMYEASTNTPGANVVCRVKSNSTKGKGLVRVNDHIKCNDKPSGNDKIHVKIKSGVHQKAM
jgi:hypothetical protein